MLSKLWCSRESARNGVWKNSKIFKIIKNWTRGASAGGSGARLFQERVFGPSGDLDFWSFGATWRIWGVILDPVGIWKGSPNRPFFWKGGQEQEKWGPRSGLEKHGLLTDFWCPNGSPEDCKKEMFAWCLLQIRRFRQLGKMIEKEMPKVIQNEPKFKPLATSGSICVILGGFWCMWNLSGFLGASEVVKQK